jgi:hypothetical protein
VDVPGSSIGLPTFVGSDDVAFTADMTESTGGVIPDRRDGDILIARPDQAIAPLVVGPTNDVTPQLSPDGLALAFGRSHAATALAALARPWEPDASSRSADLYLIGFGDGMDTLPQPVRIAEEVWPEAAWSPDGRLIATKSDDWRDLVLIELADHQAQRRLTVTGPDAWIGSFSWRPIPP